MPTSQLQFALATSQPRDPTYHATFIAEASDSLVRSLAVCAARDDTVPRAGFEFPFVASYSSRSIPTSGELCVKMMGTLIPGKDRSIVPIPVALKVVIRIVLPF